jgi:hypothetical protein
VKKFSELTEGEKKAELARWISALPAAILGSVIASIVVGSVTELVSSGGPLNSLIIELAKGATFVLAGAKCAPRCGFVVAIALAAFWILLSLAIHILAVARAGPTNYMAVVAAGVGAVAAAAFMCALQLKTTSKMR